MIETNKPTLKQRIAIKSINWAKKIATRKTKIEIAKLQKKHEIMINSITEQVQQLVTLEPEQKQNQMVAIIGANIIAGFETKQEMEITIEMIKETIQQYCKYEKITK